MEKFNLNDFKFDDSLRGFHFHAIAGPLVQKGDAQRRFVGNLAAQRVGFVEADDGILLLLALRRLDRDLRTHQHFIMAAVFFHDRDILQSIG